MAPSIDDLLATARVVSLPLHARFRGIEHREAVLLRGPAGWTEFSPFVEYNDEEAAAWLAAAVEFGWEPAPAARRDVVPVNATMPVVPVERVPEVLARFPGCRTVKVKVASGSIPDDVALVSATRDALGPEGRIRIDANGGWTVDEAERAIHALSRTDLEYVEQPCETVDELVELRRRIRHLDIPIAADESVRKADDPLAVARAGAADILVLKAQPLGGVGPVLRIASEAGLPVVVSSALDTSVGLGMGLALAAALPSLEFDCGLGTAALLSADVTDDPLLPVDGALDVRRVSPSEELLELHAATPERTRWWLARLQRCAAVLGLR